MSYSENELSDIKIKILSEIDKTSEALKKLEELTKPISPENAIGRVSRMDAINNRSINEAALEKTSQKLKHLKVALSKFNDTDFGLCRRCNQQIPVGRIILMPQTNLCVSCASGL